MGIDSLKTTSLDEMSEICLAISLGTSLIKVGGWFGFLLIYTDISGFLYGWYLSVSIFILTSRKLTILRLVCNVMFKPHYLKCVIMAFLLLAISGPDRFLTIAKPLSLYKPTRSLSRILPDEFNI